jgi:glycosyltransferase involved in cell wall biosynthesis
VNQSQRAHVPVTYLPYAQDTNLEAIDKNEVSRLQDKYKDCFNIIFLGSMIRNYGLFLMLDAFVELSKQNQTFRLHLIGDGQDLEDARAFVRDQGLSELVTFTGYLPEDKLSVYLRIANAFLAPLYPTVQDQARCPSKTYLYLPFRKPVLTCRIGESAELFSDERLFFRPGDSLDLADKIRSLEKDIKYPLPEPALHTWQARAATFNQDVAAAWTD